MNVRKSFVALVAIAGLNACGPGDSALQQRVDGILAHPDNEMSWVAGTVSKGTLTLTGMAPSEEAKAGAASLASQIPGLKAVVDQTALDTVLIRHRTEKAACDAGIASALEVGQITFSGTTIVRQSRAILDQIANALQACPDAKIEVAGHTDSSGSEAGNQRVSEQRAQAAVDYLVGRGIDRERFTAVGYGPSRPIADNGTAAGRTANRRVEFTVSF